MALRLCLWGRQFSYRKKSQTDRDNLFHLQTGKIIARNFRLIISEHSELEDQKLRKINKEEKELNGKLLQSLPWMLEWDFLNEVRIVKLEPRNRLAQVQALVTKLKLKSSS